MTDITIPLEALEAAQDALAKHVNGHASKKATRAACLAMLKAWPGAWPYKYHDNGERSLILPLPPEKETSE